MTSSLVGSEMCIRDRWMSQVWDRLYQQLRMMTRSFIAIAGPIETISNRPAVSYTHLTLPTIC
eukprot:12176392-Prorocentrum_lima.AAC.1